MAKIEFQIGLSGDVDSDKNYVHKQGIPSAIWNVEHNLKKKPSVTIVDSAGTEVEGEVIHVDENNAIINFSVAFSGEAFFN